MVLKRSMLLVATLLVVTMLGGCTRERAIALKAAAETFASQAAAAIDATIDLHVRGTYGPPRADEVMLARARDAVYLTQQNSAAALPQVIDESFKWVEEREQFRRSAFPQASQLKQAYAEFAVAFRRLPEGSVVAARDVACAAGLGARLVSYMAHAARTLQASPVPLIDETTDSTTSIRRVAADAVRTQNQLVLDAALRSHMALLREQSRANQEVVARLTDAAEAGAAVLDMIEKYDDVSAADLAAAVRRVLVIRESSFGLSSQAQLQRLDSVMEKIASKEALLAAANLPLNHQPADCQ